MHIIYISTFRQQQKNKIIKVFSILHLRKHLRATVFEHISSYLFMPSFVQYIYVYDTKNDNDDGDDVDICDIFREPSIGCFRAFKSNYNHFNWLQNTSRFTQYTRNIHRIIHYHVIVRKYRFSLYTECITHIHANIKSN